MYEVRRPPSHIPDKHHGLVASNTHTHTYTNFNVITVLENNTHFGGR